MAMPISTGTLSKLLWPGVNKIWGLAMKEFKPEYIQIFTTMKSDRNFEEDVMISGFGLFGQKPEGTPVSYQTMRMGFTTRYTPVVFAGGFMITREAFEDNQYKSQINLKANALAKAEKQTRETIGANVINRAFNASYLGGDGVSLVNASHPLYAGGTASNILSTAANFSEAALEDLCIQIMKATDDSGLKANIMPQSILLPPDLLFEAERVLKTEARVGTPNNDLNALKALGKFPGGIIMNHYLTSTTAWFILTDQDNGLKYVERRNTEFGADNDFDSENAKFKASARYVFGWTDWRAIYGSAGT